jgi:hypothetical protein
MIVADTNQEIVEQKCSICGIMKKKDRIVKNRKLCKDCNNKKKAEKVKDNLKNIDESSNKTCTQCNSVKTINLFSRSGLSNICIDCSNLKRRAKYNTYDDIRKKAVIKSTEFKQKKKAIRDELKQAELEKLEKEIGKDNTICKYCKEVKPKTGFRHNRLKCKDCERDEPVEKFKRNIRNRIYIGLKQNKPNHTHEYLGCSTTEYIKWLTYNNTKGYTLDNHGAEWHIDHVIPISKFNMKNKKEIALAFNWRNTMPLAAKENLAKNNKILLPQLKEHYENLQKYHKENNMKMPQKFINLYAKHLEAGNP